MRHRRGLSVTFIVLLVGLLTYAGVSWYEQQRVRHITASVLERVYVRALRDYYELINDVWRQLQQARNDGATFSSPLWQSTELQPMGESPDPDHWQIRLQLESMTGTIGFPEDTREASMVDLYLMQGEQSLALVINLQDWMTLLLRDAGITGVDTRLVSSVGGPESGDAIYFDDFFLPQLSLRFDTRLMQAGFHSPVIPWLAAAMAMLVAGLLYLILQQRRHQDEVVLSERMHSAEQLATLGEMAAGIAHEINNPLAYIDSNLNGLVDDLEALNEFIRLLDNASDHLDIRNPFYQQTLSGYQDLNIAIVCENAPVRVRDCINGVQRIEQIINDMRTLSHGGSEGQSLTDINADLPAVFHIIESRLSDDISFETRLTEVPLTRCNPSQIAQVVMNILVNAVHALEEKATPGSLGVYQRIVGDQLLMEIVDTGTGMAPEVQSRIFEPFYTTREKGKGTGIGLALCYKLMREHDGEIRVSSRLGAGTTFSLTIPLRTGDSDNAQ